MKQKIGIQKAAKPDRHLRAELVDVTIRLVDAFHPTAKQRQRAIEIQAKPPQQVKD